MAKCEDCEKLAGASSKVEPHSELKEIGRQEYTAANLAFSIRYRCQRCATGWERDMDHKDSGANWAELSPT